MDAIAGASKVSTYPVRIDYFSGKAADLKRHKRTPEDVLECLRTDPRVSVWDMDAAWLRLALANLVRRGLIAEVKEDSYPWLRYKVLTP